MGDASYKIVRVIDRMVVGGPSTHVQLLCGRMDPRRFRTRLVTGSAARGESECLDAKAADIAAERIVVERIPEMSRELGWQDLRVILRIYRLLLRERPDLLHTHKSKAGAAGRIAALLYRLSTPSILVLRPRPLTTLHTFHGHVLKGYFSPARTRLFAAIERFLARWATDRLLVVSEQQRRELLGEFRIGRPAQFVVMRLGRELEVSRQAAIEAEAGQFRRRHAIGADEFVVAAVGRLVPIKNLQLLLDAFAGVAGLHPGRGWRLVLVGDGELRGELEQQAGRLGIAEKVVFAGIHGDCLPLYREFDLLAISSNNEGTPLAAIEALSQGCAVVSTEVGGVVDLMGAVERREGEIKFCQHGAMVPAGDAASLAGAIERLAVDLALRHRCAEAGRDYVRRWHSAERLVRDMESLYAGLLGDGLPGDGSRQTYKAISPGRTLRLLLRRAAKAGQAMASGIWG